MAKESSKYNDDYYYKLARLNIKKYRNIKNYTTQELADKCDLTHQFIDRKSTRLNSSHRR